ncbi:non-hydrolyzing UDP-N-acetylglucosamine 2-epimerase [Salinimicrobium sp. CAU 1759]
MKILLCFGTRPEAIKMAPIAHELKKRDISHNICVTAQHREMLDQVLIFFELEPKYDLDLMLPEQSLNLLSSRIFSAIDKVFDKEDPEMVLVHGDTTTSSIIAMAAFHRGIKVGHVEAGLRTYNKKAPFPEEINRQLTARIADLHFAPTEKSKSNLLKEQIPEEQIYQTGNTVVDALQWGHQKISAIPLQEEGGNVKRQLDPQKKVILVTGHRRESFGKGLEDICRALLLLAEREDVEIIYPVHLNPKVRKPVYDLLKKNSNIHLIDPVAYPTMLWLMQESTFIISDSGGIQEEAPAFKKPVLVTREVSERMEGVEAGFSILVGTDTAKIVAEAVRLIENSPDLNQLDNPYGDGKAAERIVDVLEAYERSTFPV